MKSPSEGTALTLKRDSDSAHALRRKLYAFVQQEALGPEVINELLPNGEPHLFEKPLWDYKMELPIPSPSSVDVYPCKMAEIVKDVVAFYNSLGGYLLAGVSDNPRKVTGFEKQFDCGELAKKIKSATGVEIDCHYRVLKVSINGTMISVGLLQIPQRPESETPAQFRSNAPATLTGKMAFKRDDIYLRIGDQCRPATSSEDFSFLCSQGRRKIAGNTANSFSSVVASNLGPRDPSFIRFVGRSQYLETLWKWFCDRYSSVKLIAGLGGLGKTTIAREFTEDITRAAPMGLDKVIWLSAKKQFYAAILDKYVPTSRVDFIDLQSLLIALLGELGHPEGTISPDMPREELIDLCIYSFKEFPSLVVIDDVDSLEADEQSDIFQTMVLIMNRSQSVSGVYSRCLLTARLDLGAAPGQLIRLAGLGMNEFLDFLKMTADGLDIPLNYSKKQLEAFHKDSGGSPTFASSVLRLLQTGESLGNALNTWRGSDGEAVRKFAFERELERLTDTQVKILYALCILGETTLLELQNVLQSPDGRLRDDLGELRKYHLVALASELPIGGARMQIPTAIRLMKDLIRSRIKDASRIEQDCARVREGTPRLGLDVGRIVGQVIELWRNNNNDHALEVARFALKQSPKNGDIACLVGRAYLKKDPPDYRNADISFRKANELGCTRTEIFGFWTQTKQALSDWSGLIEITRMADNGGTNSDLICMRANCYLQLGDLAIKSSNMSRALEYYRDGGRDIASIFERNLARIRVMEMRELKSTLLSNYVRTSDLMHTTPRDKLNVWLAVVDSFKCYVRRQTLLRLGLARLTDWWENVRQRDNYDDKASDLMRIQLGTLEMIISQMKLHDIVDQEFINELTHGKELLTNNWRSYVSKN